MNELKIIGKNIARLRKLRKLTQEDLCGAADMDRSYLSELENGKINVSIKTLVEIATVLKCDLKDIIIKSL